MDYYNVHPVAGVETSGNRKRIREWVADGTTDFRTRPFAEVGVPSAEWGRNEKTLAPERKGSSRKK
jgi:hypothetical protein